VSMCVSEFAGVLQLSYDIDGEAKYLVPENVI